MAYNYYSNYNDSYMRRSPYQMPIQAPTSQMQIQNGGIVFVNSEQEARNYPVAPGNSVTFKDETLPYVYTKTMGFSQLDQPVFEKYKLIKEEVADDNQTIENSVAKNIENEISRLWAEIDALKESRRPAPKKEISFDV